MKKICCFCFALICFANCVNGQAKIIHTDEWINYLNTPSSENIQRQIIAEDSFSTTMVISIASELKAHYHDHHSENIMVLEGEAELIINGIPLTIKRGDYINIPPRTLHTVKVTSAYPLKVLSVLSPKFNDNDRVFLDANK